MGLPLVRGSGGDTVLTGHGCDTTTKTDQCSPNVFVNGKGLVRSGDLNLSHLFPFGPCIPHTVPLSTFSSTVFANGRGVARLGDKYVNEEIITGSGNVTCG